LFTDSTLLHRLAPGQAVISLPGLSDALPLGGGCCAMAADDAVLNELISWPGIASASVDSVAETATVTLDPTIPDQLEYVADALRDLGFTKVEITRPA
jgi:hypothetical protein